MRHYIGTYRVFPAVDLETGKASSNKDDTYLKTKYKSQIYRHTKSKLALLLTTGNSIKNVPPQLEQAGVKLILHFDGDCEAIYLFSEKDMDKVAKIMKPQVKGKDIPPESVKTRRRV